MKELSLQKTSDRRANPRITMVLPITINYKSEGAGQQRVSGSINSISGMGLACHLEKRLPENTSFIYFLIRYKDKDLMHSGRVVWANHETKQYGVRYDETPAWLYPVIPFEYQRPTSDRRVQSRRRNLEGSGPAGERRVSVRRYADLLEEVQKDVEEGVENTKVKCFLRSKSATHTAEIIKNRREWVEEISKVEFNHVAEGSENVEEFCGKIENPIGVAHIPLGVAGPLRINGRYARGTFYIPLATTEGALITSYTLGSNLVTRSGGANVKILKDELRMAPMFVFKSMMEADAFISWIKTHSNKIKQIAEKTSGHLMMTKTSVIQDGRRVILNFHYSTGDAMGMNMAGKATDAVCDYLRSVVKPEEFWLRSNFNANKKVTANNFINGYGKTVIADVTIPRRLLSIMRTTPEEMERYFFRTLLSDTHAVQIGANGHFANALTALYIATGQDVASVATSHVGISTCETTKNGDLYFSAYLSNLLLGTVGGGTGFGTARECLAMMDCFGSGKAKKLAEIVAAVALAGEVSICASIVNGTYVLAHELFGRNRPKDTVSPSPSSIQKDGNGTND